MESENIIRLISIGRNQSQSLKTQKRDINHDKIDELSLS